MRERWRTWRGGARRAPRGGAPSLAEARRRGGPGPPGATRSRAERADPRAGPSEPGEDGAVARPPREGGRSVPVPDRGVPERGQSPLRAPPLPYMPPKRPRRRSLKSRCLLQRLPTRRTARRAQGAPLVPLVSLYRRTTRLPHPPELVPGRRCTGPSRRGARSSPGRRCRERACGHPQRAVMRSNCATGSWRSASSASR